MKKIKGIAIGLRKKDDINTDYVISGRYKFRIQDPKELAKHIFEDLEKDFCRRLKKFSILVTGNNFGCGSSREQAPQALKAAGVQAVLAKSFARIFYRNAFNIGLPLLECDTDLIEEGDSLTLDLAGSHVVNNTKNNKIKTKTLPSVMLKLLEDGGVIEHFNKYGRFKV